MMLQPVCSTQNFRNLYRKRILIKYIVPMSLDYTEGLPTRTLIFERQICAPTHDLSKEHLTVMCCGKASENHELKLLH
jgi:hypothetical protein